MNSPGQIGKQTVRFWSPSFFFQSCADSHSFCEPIYSEDTNLFQFMKTPMAVVVSSPWSWSCTMHHTSRPLPGREGKCDGQASAESEVTPFQNRAGIEPSRTQSNPKNLIVCPKSSVKSVNKR